MANFPPSKYLLYNLAQKLFGLNTAALAEPIIATFCRAIVDAQNNPLLTAAQLRALSTLAQTSQSSTPLLSFPIPAGQDFVHVTGLALAFTPVRCLPTVMKITGGANLGAICRLDTLSPDGFTADLTGVTDGDAYVLAFLLS